MIPLIKQGHEGCHLPERHGLEGECVVRVLCPCSHQHCLSNSCRSRLHRGLAHLARDAQKGTRGLLLLLYVAFKLWRNISYGKAQEQAGLLMQPMTQNKLGGVSQWEICRKTSSFKVTGNW